MTTTDLDERTALSDRAVALLRTAVPGLWAALVTTLLRIISPHLPGEVGIALADLLRSELAVTFVVVLVLALWYWLWRKVEPLVPDWLVRLVLGSARTPWYGLPAAIVEADDVLTAEEAALVADYRALEARPDPADIDDPDDDVDEVVTD